MPDQVFRSGSGRAKVVVWLFGAAIVIELVSIGSNMAQIELLRRMDGGGNWTVAEVNANDLRATVIGFIAASILLAGMIAFLFWVHRARANLPALGIENARWTPGWAVGWWFVPIMSAFRPFQVVKEIWKASDPEARPDSWRDIATPSLLGWWWALFLICLFADRLAYRITVRGPETIDGYVAGLAAYSVSEAFWVLGAIPAIMVVRGIDRRQIERHAALSQVSPTEVHTAPV